MLINLVTADAADWIRNAAIERCKTAEIRLDPFKFVAWATDALCEVCRAVWKEARLPGGGRLLACSKVARFALWKNPENRTPQARLAPIEKTNAPLYRACLLKEQLCQILQPVSEEPHRRWLLACLNIIGPGNAVAALGPRCDKKSPPKT